MIKEWETTTQSMKTQAWGPSECADHTPTKPSCLGGRKNLVKILAKRSDLSDHPDLNSISRIFMTVCIWDTLSVSLCPHLFPCGGCGMKYLLCLFVLTLTSTV